MKLENREDFIAKEKHSRNFRNGFLIALLVSVPLVILVISLCQGDERFWVLAAPIVTGLIYLATRADYRNEFVYSSPEEYETYMKKALKKENLYGSESERFINVDYSHALSSYCEHFGTMDSLIGLLEEELNAKFVQKKYYQAGPRTFLDSLIFERKEE